MRNQDGLTHWCRDCFNSQSKIWRDGLREERETNPLPRIKSKVCTRCGIEREIDNFHHSIASKDGYKNQCKECLIKFRANPEEENERVCKKCNVKKSIDKFYKCSTGPNGISRWCKECAKEYSSKWNRENRDKISARGREWNYSRFGVDEGWYEQKLLEQRGLCAICGSPSPSHGQKSKNRFAIDHDHSCCGPDKMCDKCRRGLLCIRCNTWLERLENFPQIVKRAMDYLKRYKHPQNEFENDLLPIFLFHVNK